jgi:LPPG:FO 2-phospho-L-lactate transferase
MNVVALAGGVGGAKLAHGLALVLNPQELTVVVNTGDDFQHLGLHISPDLDTVMYTLAGLANPETGWGLAGETWNFLEALQRLGGDAWFRLGDRDLATHVERSRRLWGGATLTEVTAALCAALGVGPRVLPMTDDMVQTRVETSVGELEFQEYFVHQQCHPRVTGFRFAGLESAVATDPVLEALASASLVVLCPSNPFVSLDPILSLPAVRQSLASKPVTAVSPIVGGRALKGPAAKMLAELGLEVSPTAVARHYAGLLQGFVMDTLDEALAPEIRRIGLRVLVTNTIMTTLVDRARLAGEVLKFGIPE